MLVSVNKQLVLIGLKAIQRVLQIVMEIVQHLE